MQKEPGPHMTLTLPLLRHWDEFVTFEDLKKLSDAGISHLRIPVGYWMVDVAEDEPFPPAPTDDEGARFFLKRAAGSVFDDASCSYRECINLFVCHFSVGVRSSGLRF